MIRFAKCLAKSYGVAAPAVSFVFVFAGCFFVVGFCVSASYVSGPLWEDTENWFRMWSGSFLVGAAAAWLSVVTARQTAVRLRRPKT